MYRIFYLNKALFLCDSPMEKVNSIKIENINDLCLALRQWQEEDEEQDLCFYGLPTEKLLSYLKDFYTYREAAGGIVKNNKGEYLFIKRFGVWDLPKGKLENGETPEKAAIREVEEETGVRNLSISKQINDSWHIYPWKGKTVLKKTYWYLMNSNYEGTLIPQTGEDITEAVWLNQKDAKEKLKNYSYRSLSENLLEFIR